MYHVKPPVDSYGGYVKVEYLVPGNHTKGARFVVLLPVAQRPWIWARFVVMLSAAGT